MMNNFKKTKNQFDTTSNIQDEILQNTYKKVSVLQELYIEFFATFIPGSAFLVILVFFTFLFFYTLEGAYPDFCNSLSDNLGILRETNSWVWFLIFIFFSYVAGGILYRKDPNRPDYLSSFKQWRDASDIEKNKLAVQFWDFECCNANKFFFKKVKKNKKTAKNNNKEDIQQSSNESVPEKDIASYPYGYLREYLLKRGMKHLIVFVPWCMHRENVSSTFRSKVSINILKTRIKMTRNEYFINDLLRNEGHIRMLTSLWFAFRFLSKILIAIMFFSVTVLLITTILKSFYPKIDIGITFDYHKICWCFVLYFLLLYLLRTGINSICKSIHYVRLREIVTVLESAYILAKNGLLSISDYIQRNKENFLNAKYSCVDKNNKWELRCSEILCQEKCFECTKCQENHCAPCLKLIEEQWADLYNAAECTSLPSKRTICKTNICNSRKRIVVTGGAGFIGSAVVRHIINDTADAVCVVDKLTYAGNLENLSEISSSDRFRFEQVDICDKAELDRIFADFKPTHVMHLAAESHVDRSIDGPGEFIQTNIVGTYTLLEAARKYFNALDDAGRAAFKFHYISTDEVYGDLEGPEDFFREDTPYAPSSPYSASKASSDHLVRAWKRTFGLPTVVTNCSNNYGPYHFPEKLIPLVILHALDGKELPVYGEGLQIRDWLYVEDHARALYLVATEGAPGETYNIGGHNEKKNIEVVKTICALLDELRPRPDGKGYAEQIVHVKDRPGHDLRYAIDPSKIDRELGWKPQETFESGIRKTVMWYLEHKDDWCAHVLNGSYKMERLGTGGNN